MLVEVGCSAQYYEIKSPLLYLFNLGIAEPLNRNLGITDPLSDATEI